MHGDPGRKESWYWTHSGPLIVSAWTTLTSLLQHVLMLSLNFLSEQQLVLLHCWYRALVLFQNCNDVLQFSIIKINCCLSCSYHIDYVFINEGVFIGPTQGPHTLQLCMGLSYFWRVWPLLTTLPYFAHCIPIYYSSLIVCQFLPMPLSVWLSFRGRHMGQTDDSRTTSLFKVSHHHRRAT